MIDVQNMKYDQILAEAIINTIPDPLVMLDDQFRVLAASLSFHETFGIDPAQVRGHVLYTLGDGRWDTADLRAFLRAALTEHAPVDGLEVEHDVPGLGDRIMLLNARRVIHDGASDATILLAFTDMTARRTIEREKEGLLKHAEDLLRQKDVLLQEMQHRVTNSLQIIASILLLKARAVTSEETRLHLRDAHQRVMSVAEVQRHLHISDSVDQIDVGPYLTKLCNGLASSMVGEGQPIKVQVMADEGRIGSDKAVSLGLIVTELVINAIKYAFPATRADAIILVTYEIHGADWKLTVSDNGVGKDAAGAAEKTAGLGGAIVKALATQLEARLESVSSTTGLRVSVTRATFTSHMPQVA